jgi:TRAP-type C4-dicarboxylate transport system substrate-binding protein
MSDAPESIYAWDSAGDFVYGGWSLTDDWEATSKTEYTRTDISQARIAELEARNGKLGEAVAYATQKFTHQEAQIAELADALQSILRVPNSEAAQGIMKAFARDALEPKP